MGGCCPKCLNTYPTWSGTSCKVCDRNQGDARRYRTTYKSSTEKYLKYSSNKHKQARPTAKQESRPRTHKPNRRFRKSVSGSETIFGDALNNAPYRIRARGINRMLKDVYRGEEHISQILERRGVSREQIDRVSGDPDWKSTYLYHLTRRFARELKKKYPAYQVHIFLLSYGLISASLRNSRQIASDVGVSEGVVIATKRRNIAFLRTDEGRVFLEGCIVQVFRQTFDQ